jgi:A/G-specific adenine glycosylase
LLQKRPAEGIWGGLWGLPEALATGGIDSFCREQLGVNPQFIETWPAVQHGFTHFDLEMTPVHARLEQFPPRTMEAGRWLWYNLREPAAVGLAAPVTRLLATLGERS